MENENNVSIVTNERDYTKAVTGGSFNIFKAVKISKFNILKRRAAKAAKKAEKLQKQSEAYAAERDATKENVDNNFLFNVFNNKSKEKQQESNKYVEKAIIANTKAALVEADLKVLYQNKASKPIRLRQGIKNIASKWNNWLKSKIVKSKAVDVPVNDNIEITKNNSAEVENVAKIRRPAAEVAPTRKKEKMQAMATIIDDNFWKTKEDDKENDNESEKLNSNAIITNDDLTFKEHISRQKPLPSAYTIKVPQEDAENKLNNNNDLVFEKDDKEKSWVDMGKETINGKSDITFNTKTKNSVSPVKKDETKSETPKAKEENKEKSSSFSLQQKKAMLEAVKKAKEQQDKQAELAMKKMKEAREKAEKDIADRLAAEEAALQKEIEESKQNVANAQKETNQDIADMYKSFGYEVPEEYLSSGKTK